MFKVAEAAGEEKGTLGFLVLGLEDDEMLIWGPRGEVRPAPHTHALSHLHTQQNQRNLIVELWKERACAEDNVAHAAPMHRDGGVLWGGKGGQGRVERGEQDNKPIIGLRETLD